VNLPVAPQPRDSPLKAVTRDAHLLEVRSLVKYFPIRQGWLTGHATQVHAVDGVSLHLDRGEVLGLVGESGCGKSTTARLVLRLIEPTSGEVRFMGHDLLQVPYRRLRPLRRDIQMIFQDPYASLNPRMRIGTILEEPLIIHGVKSKAERAERVVSILEKVGLQSDALGKYPHEFSGGQRQRVGIARALILNPQLIVADEPVSSLDVSIQAQIVNLLQDLQAEYRLSLLFIAHDLLMVRHISDRVAVMYLGRIVEVADVPSLFTRPKHPYTQLLLDSVPVPDPSVKHAHTAIQGDPPSPVDIPAGCRFYARCPKRIPDCLAIDPPLTEIEPGHWVACIRATA